jgi:hypothetical protein
MNRTERPNSGTTTYHRDATVTLWNCIASEWQRGCRPSDELLSTLPDDERQRVIRHTGGDR